MKGLLIIDVHKKFLKGENGCDTKNKILAIGELFKNENLPIFIIKHDDCGELDNDINNLSDILIKKDTPSAFFNTPLKILLDEYKVTELVIVGFNIEYCVLFTAISAFELGLKVHVVEDACGTVNDENTYDMPGLDINDFIGSILNWSKVIEVPYLDEYLIYHKNS
ncbi:MULTISPECIES: cysteine hydrolase family protein [Mammaliicoccus]|uniref:cysteine hydrolase family protein n=1 Tax=Mammaliicoccus TaxID=2803850 RepID=UPI001952A5C1|nr:MULTISPECIES: isochorismatase family protein [Mammaliicoccus]MCD8894533.1 isochorismatase family protein [Mammaliicoccus sciuri]MCD8912722.1 isochorismatase family protein [Mammaliicoccus sciuri]MCJ1764632.1 isochorismatase family protein [Mammaliicoccus sciuri]MCJ1773512.1 isochorismatase family protein [Mammaliicoccus sciuri]